MGNSIYLCGRIDDQRALGLPQAAPDPPPSHENAHIWLPVGSTRSFGLLDRKRCWAIWPLRQFSSAQDGSVRRFHQRAVGSLLDQNTAENVFREDGFDGEDYADSREQFIGTSAQSANSAPQASQAERQD